MQADLELDCRGMHCPMPIVELSKATRSLGPGKRIEVTATDLAFKPDVEAWARRTGHNIVEFRDEDGQQIALILTV